MGSRNITFNLPEELLRAARIYAAEHDTTVNAVVRGLLEEKLAADARSQAAARRLLSIAARGPLFNADPGSFRREELHERR